MSNNVKNNKKEQLFEEKRLIDTISLVERQVAKAEERSAKIKEQVAETRQELRENSEHSIGNLWGSEAFEALAELSQYTNELNDRIVDGEETEREIRRLQNMIATPYFARIDFKFDDENESEKVYIGKTALKSDVGADRFIYDWRSPIASVFYRFMTGRAFYEAPAGRIAGEVLLKRQFEIKNSKLEYFFDSDVNVVDEFLRKALSQNTSPQMKTIVETIQKEQDVVIRDMENELMMVQGVAGSGKTSIALHRAAYLMYRGLTESLSPEDILIVSPNSLFEQYIANVLPELGEENVSSAIWEEMAFRVLRKKKIQTREQFLEKVVTNKTHSEIIKNCMVFKNSLEFLQILRKAIDDLISNGIVFEDIYSNGNRIASGEYLKGKILAGSADVSLRRRLKILEEHVLDLISDAGNGRVRKGDRTRVREYMRKCASIKIEVLYRRLFEDDEYFARMSAGIKLPDNIAKIVSWTKENLTIRRYFYDDIAPLMYLNVIINGVDTYREIKQVVIDEAQDYYPMHFEVFKLLFSKAKLTVLGDVNQTLEKTEDSSMYKQIAQIFGKKLSSLVEMDKSFRCTSEILKFSSKFLNHKVKIESFNRNGREPRVFTFDNRNDFRYAIIAKIMGCQTLGYQSIGLICKTRGNASHLYNMLKFGTDIKLVTGSGTEETQGTFIIPAYMAKGLEFDAVMICDADSENYCREIDKNILYIAATRALHQLDLFCIGEVSPFIENER